MPRQRDLMAGITCKHKSFSIHKLFKINYKFVNESLFTFNDTRTPTVQVRKKCGTEVQKHVTLSIQNIRVITLYIMTHLTLKGKVEGCIEQNTDLRG